MKDDEGKTGAEMDIKSQFRIIDSSQINWYHLKIAWIILVLLITASAIGYALLVPNADCYDTKSQKWITWEQYEKTYHTGGGILK
jgi:hypothetical protein